MIHRLPLLLIACCLATPDSAVFSQNQDVLRGVQRDFNQQIKPLLAAHCSDCHSGGAAADAGLDLTGFETIDQLLNARKTWNKIRVRVAAKEMPPEEGDPLAEQDHEAMLDWINQLLDSVDCTEIDPGRVTIRRLNRTEYRNTIVDLMGIDYQPADSFPGDDVGYGFDNIGDVLSLPPLLMEKYLAAADEICHQAIVDPDHPQFKQRIAGSEFSSTAGSHSISAEQLLTTNGTVNRKFKTPKSGRYELRFTLNGDQAGEDPVKVKIKLDGRTIIEKSVTASGEDYQSFDVGKRLKAGQHELAISFVNDFFDQSLPAGSRDRNLRINSAEIRGPLDLPKSHRQIIGKRPAAEQQFDAARSILGQFMSRAYRRRVTDGELDRLMVLYQQTRDSGDSYEASIRIAMQAVLVSPYFLYKIETPVAAGESRVLNGFELATNLSYFLWSSMPDDKLFQLAAAGKLKDRDVYLGQVQRMVADPKSQALIENFAAQWLQLRNLDLAQPDPEMFPGIDLQLRQDMATETKLVVAELIRRDASVLELLKSDFTFLNQRLAEHYGVDEIQGDEFRLVSADRTNRVGLLSHASILTLTSNPTRTSPVKRGKWIMENLLGEEPPPPDPEAMKLEDQAELSGTLRQQMEQHRADPNCAVCHKVMDELGFALENYDAVGQWREQEQDAPIDAHGELPDGTRFEGPLELQAMIQTEMGRQFVRCLVEKMLIYALGRGLEYYDECAIDKIIDHMHANEYRFSALIHGVVTSDPFVRRRGASRENP